jgi:hypothetical protein
MAKRRGPPRDTSGRFIDAESAKRSDAAKQGWETRREELRESTRDAVARWGRALDRARDMNSRAAWQAFRRADERRREMQETARQSRMWEDILDDIMYEAEDVFDIDKENYDTPD